MRNTKIKPTTISKGCIIALTIIVILSLTYVSQNCFAQTIALEDKATAFLTNVIQLDLSHYDLTINPQYTRTEDGHLFYNLDSKTEFLGSSHGIALFNFYNGTLGSCSISPGIDGIAYTTPFSDRYNTTLGILERYQTWSNDLQVQNMVALLKGVGEEKIGLYVAGNLSLRIQIYQSGFGVYQFSNYLNGVEYTYISISMNNQTSGDVNLIDSRVFQKIGDTNINISKDQAIAIAQDAVEHYSYNHTFGNDTSETLGNFTVTGVYSTSISSIVREDSTLYPLYDVQLNVTGLPSQATGLGVKIWANNGAVVSVYHYIYPDSANFTDLMTNIFVYPMWISAIASLGFFIAIIVVAVVVILVVLKKNNKTNVNPKTTSPPTN